MEDTGKMKQISRGFILILALVCVLRTANAKPFEPNGDWWRTLPKEAKFGLRDRLHRWRVLGSRQNKNRQSVFAEWPASLRHEGFSGQILRKSEQPANSNQRRV
jgi:hypothetical protein